MDPTTHYLLDRTHITDTLVTMYMAVDTKQPQLLRSAVFAPEILVDYTALFGGGEPKTHTIDSLVGEWEGLVGKLKASQHTISSILPSLSLSQYTKTSAPDLVQVSANGGAWLTRNGPDGEDVETRNGSRMELEVIKVPGVEGEDCWRVSKIRACGGGWSVNGEAFWGGL